MPFRTAQRVMLGWCVAMPATLGAGAQSSPAGTPVDRNVADTSANAVSQRVVQPGIGQFGAALIDRLGGSDPYNPARADRFADPRTNQRYVFQQPGVTALVDRPDYLGPSDDPAGGWVLNGQTVDGQFYTLAPANTVYVLSPELLRGPTPDRRSDFDPPSEPADPARVTGVVPGDPYGLMRDARVDGRYDPSAVRVDLRTIREHQSYRDPAIIERERRLREEREQQSAAQQQQQSADSDRDNAADSSETAADDSD